MAVGGLIRAFSGQAGSGRSGRGAGDSVTADGVSVIRPADTAKRLALLDDFEATGLDWLWATNPDGRLIYVSESAARDLGRSLEELLGKPFVALFEIDRDNGQSERTLQFMLNAHSKIADVVVRYIPAPHDYDARPRWLQISAHPKFDEGRKFQGYRGNARDVTLEYQRQVEDSLRADYDSLTGLSNRHRMVRRLEGYLASFRAAGRSCALLSLDLDRFKQVNDTMGHPAGDELLRQVSARLRGAIGDRGEVGRLGGDEFQIILPDIDDRGKLGELANSIVQIVSQPYPIEGKRAVIGTSVGIAIAPYDGVDKDELVRSSDLALYAAKNGGRGQFRFYSADLKDEQEERRLLVDDLRDALANGQLQLHYQPVVRAADHIVVGFEALMRWNHPERGMISPAVFIPIAEELNLINQLGEWALNRACQDALAWPSSVRVAVNVSAVQFATNDFPEIVTAALDASGLEPDRLELELTESVFVGDSNTIDTTFGVLKQVGVRLALDDFGTGYSSLSYLRSAPFDKLKVDKSFVDSCTQTDRNSAKIIAAIISLSDALGMETTVEGVEAFDQFELVCAKGAKYIQGWIYSKALTLEEIAAQMGSGDLRIEPAGPELYRPDRRTVFRRIGIIHEDHRYEAVMRDLSKSGARVEGLLGVPEGTGLVLDLGAGQLVVSKVMRSADAMIGVEFEIPLVSDGAGGLCTRHRVSPCALAAAGMPLTSLSHASHSIPPPKDDGGASKPAFLEVVPGRA